MNTEETKYDELVTKIMQAIYWRTITKKENKAIISILEDADFVNSEKANLICEYLQIEKRNNRSAITQVLDSYNQLSTNK